MSLRASPMSRVQRGFVRAIVAKLALQDHCFAARIPPGHPLLRGGTRVEPAPQAIKHRVSVATGRHRLGVKVLPVRFPPSVFRHVRIANWRCAHAQARSNSPGRHTNRDCPPAYRLPIVCRFRPPAPLARNARAATGERLLTQSQGAFAQGGSVQRGNKVTQDRHGQKREVHADSGIPGNASIRT